MMGKATDYATPFPWVCWKKGVLLETVSLLLARQSLKITQKHYSPWVKTRQEALDQEVSRALSA